MKARNTRYVFREFNGCHVSIDVFWPVFGFVVGPSDEDINNSASKNLPDYVCQGLNGACSCVWEGRIW